MKVKVSDYTNRSGPIRWLISTSIKVMLEHFSLALTVFQIFTFKYRDLENVGQSWCTTFAVAPYDGKYLISVSDGNSSVCIFAKETEMLYLQEHSTARPWNSRQICRRHLLQVHFYSSCITWNVWPWNRWTKSWSTKFTTVLSDGEYQPI